jgi:hypothetical protein
MLNFVDGKETNQPIPMIFKSKKTDLHLTLKERSVLYGLLKFPEDSDKYIADKLRISRQIVSTTKMKLERENLIRAMVILDHERFACSAIAFIYMKAGPMSSMSVVEKKGNPVFLKTAPAILFAAGHLEWVGLAPIRNYIDLERIKRQSISQYKKYLPIVQTPRIILFSLENLMYYKPITLHQLFTKKKTK